MTKCFVVSRCVTDCPILVADCGKVTEEDDHLVSQKLRLDHRVLDLRVPANQAIFRIQSKIAEFFREFLLARKFQEIHTPKLVATASEGGSNVFAVKYFDGAAYLAQSPQLYKQMCVVSGMPRVFEVGPVFRAEPHHSHRHLTEFTGLDGEMAIVDDYHEALDMCKDTLVSVFTRLQTECADDIAVVRAQFPSEPLEIEPLVLPFSQGIEILHGIGVEIGELEDLNTENEIKLGAAIKEKFHTDFYVLDHFPAAVRPFYTMPDAKDPRYSNSFDMFLRGEEIVSGAQRVHNKQMLLQCAAAKGVDLAPIQGYVDSFQYGALPVTRE